MVEYKVIRERTKISGHTVGMDKSSLGQSDIQRVMVNRVNNCLSMSCWCGSAKNKLLWPLKLKIWGNRLEKLIESMSIVISKVGQVQFSVCEGKCFHTPRPPPNTVASSVLLAWATCPMLSLRPCSGIVWQRAASHIPKMCYGTNHDIVSANVCPYLHPCLLFSCRYCC